MVADPLAGCRRGDCDASAVLWRGEAHRIGGVVGPGGTRNLPRALRSGEQRSPPLAGVYRAGNVASRGGAVGCELSSFVWTVVDFRSAQQRRAARVEPARDLHVLCEAEGVPQGLHDFFDFQPGMPDSRPGPWQLYSLGS